MPPLPCPFCNLPESDVVIRSTLCYARYDRFPVSRGHMLVIPFRHVESFFDLTGDERDAIMAMVAECRALIESRGRPDGYNIGFNVGRAAGQTVMHCHCHVIPRYRGDTVNPRGGIRGVILTAAQCEAGKRHRKEEDKGQKHL